MPLFLETVASYVPALIARRCINEPENMSETGLERFPAAAFFADISGFTRLTEQLAQQGPAGAEELTRLLNDYFGQLIELIHAHGGEVIKFAGDALLALWPLDEENLATATYRAAQCGLEVQAKLHDYRPTAEARMTLRVGIGAGEVVVMYLGGEFGRWECLVTGEPLLQMTAAQQQAQPGEVILSNAAWDLIKDNGNGHRIGAGFTRLLETTLPLPLVAARPAPVAPYIESGLRAYIPGAVLSRLNPAETGWLAELRRVTVLFISLPDMTPDAPDSLEQAQRAMLALQKALYRFEGSLNKLSVDEKGTTLVVALGLPPLAHEDDAARGVKAAQAMQAELKKLNWNCAIGVATGRVFCGLIGNDIRREYTMIGRVVNMAARLMQAASLGEILCDNPTVTASKNQLSFDTLPPVLLKGHSEAVTVYRPLGLETVGDKGQTAIVGRELERATLIKHLQTLRKGGPGGVVIIEGEAGIGKSRLLADLRQQAISMRLGIFSGAGDAIENSTPYYVWRSVFNQIFDLEVLATTEARRSHILDLLELEPQLLPLAPLLNSVLMLDLPESEVTADLRGQVRADNTRDLLLKSLQASVGRSPKVLIIEDAHWLDSAAWALTLLVSQLVRPLLLVIATRPINEPRPPEFTKLAETADLLRLESLTSQDMQALACQYLGVLALPPQIEELLQEKTQGNPFFIGELAYSLRDSGILEINEGQCQLASDAGDLQSLNLPDTVQGAITSRIDKLTPSQQLTLKTASVLGRVFNYNLLRAVFPLEYEKINLPEHLATLELQDIITLESREPELIYSFKHVITREVAYNLMLFSQRRQLHQAAAEWYEGQQTTDLSPFYPLLAHHWGKADVIPKTLDYLEKAGEEALRGYANREAIRFFTEACALTPFPTTKLRLARWERQLGEAHLGLGQLTTSRQHLEKALTLLGWPMPTTNRQLLAGLFNQAAIQLGHRLYQSGLNAAEGEAGVTLLEAARAYERLAEIYYFDNNKTATIYASLRTLNLAEGPGLSPELARAYANMSLAAGILPSPTLAKAYEKRANTTTRKVDSLSSVARVLLASGVYDLGVGKWAKFQDELENALAIADGIGDRHRWEECTALQIFAARCQGDFAAATWLCSDLLVSARRSGNSQSQISALHGQATGLLIIGQVDSALELLDEAKRLLTHYPGRVEAIKIDSLLALAHLRRGSLELAAKFAASAMQLTSHSSPTAVQLLESYGGLAEVYRQLWQFAIDNNEGKQVELATKFGHSIHALQRYARVFPIGKARAQLWQGIFWQLQGKKEGAAKSWYKAVAAAEKLAMPYDMALAQLELAQNLANSGLGYLEKAIQNFEKTGASYELTRARNLKQELLITVGMQT